MIGVTVRTGGKPQVTAGYQDLVAFERQLLETNLQELTLDDQSPEEVANWDLISPVIRDIVQRSVGVGEAIVEDRSARTELPSEVRELLDDHEYLLEPELDIDQRRKVVEAALTTSSDQEVTDVNYAGLDPRRGSRYRQYRFLTSGTKTDKAITAPIGFA